MLPSSKTVKRFEPLYFLYTQSLFSINKLLDSLRANKIQKIISKILLALIATLLALILNLKYEIFLVLSIPQIFRHSFQKIFGTFQMREFRIFVGPAAIMVLMLTLSNWVGILKIIFIALGLRNIPSKDKNYLINKKKHGILMKIIFTITVFEWLILKYHGWEAKNTIIQMILN